MVTENLTIRLHFRSKKAKRTVIKGNESIIYINQNIYFSDRLSGMDFLKFSYGLDGKKVFNLFIN